MSREVLYPMILLQSVPCAFGRMTLDLPATVTAKDAGPEDRSKDAQLVNLIAPDLTSDIDATGS